MTYQLQLSNDPSCDCVYGVEQFYIFDFSKDGWLYAHSTKRSSIGGGGMFFIGEMQPFDLSLDSIDSVVQLTQSAFVSLVVDSRGIPLSLNISSDDSQPDGDVMSLSFDHFDHNPLRWLHDKDFAPPPNDCFIGDDSALICKGGVQTMDFYRTHDNDTWAMQLAQENAADPAGEALFLSQLTTHPFITHFRVTLNTSWVPYLECNDGQCVSYVDNLPSDYVAMIQLQQGVGRESGLGGANMINGADQCSHRTKTDYGYWFSFPAMGECMPNQSIGHNNCTWTGARVKTITLACAQSFMTGSTMEEEGQQLVHAFTKCANQKMQPPL